ncbi:hypothetical protein KIW84_UN0669 [Lathyrus oleraceus]|nr:hypothetical protein KIW84_UN0853 [Pisum sativum]KAI5381515.1 hypothetical protein KIW84_UN0669 [Pisum sativum]
MKKKPVKLFKTETASILIIYLMNCMLQNLPSMFSISRIHDNSVLESLNLKIPLPLAFFGVFDGHGGAKAAEFAANNLEKNILDEVIMSEEQDVEEAVKRGYLNTDSEFMKQDPHGGSYCVTALIRNGNLVVSNAGDCRAVISRGGVAEALTSDHRPSREDERERIETSVNFLITVVFFYLMFIKTNV